MMTLTEQIILNINEIKLFFFHVHPFIFFHYSCEMIVDIYWHTSLRDVQYLAQIVRVMFNQILLLAKTKMQELFCRFIFQKQMNKKSIIELTIYKMIIRKKGFVYIIKY